MINPETGITIFQTTNSKKIDYELKYCTGMDCKFCKIFYEDIYDHYSKKHQDAALGPED